MNPLKLAPVFYFCPKMMRPINLFLQATIKFLFIIHLLSASLVYAEAKQTVNIAYLTQEQKAKLKSAIIKEQLKITAKL